MNLNSFQQVKLLFVHIHNRMNMQRIDEPLPTEQFDPTQNPNQRILTDPIAYPRIIILSLDPTSDIYRPSAIFDSVRNVCGPFDDVENFGNERNLGNFSPINGEICIWMWLVGV